MMPDENVWGKIYSLLGMGDTKQELQIYAKKENAATQELLIFFEENDCPYKISFAERDDQEYKDGYNMLITATLGG